MSENNYLSKIVHDYRRKLPSVKTASAASSPKFKTMLDKRPQTAYNENTQKVIKIVVRSRRRYAQKRTITQSGSEITSNKNTKNGKKIQREALSTTQQCVFFVYATITNTKNHDVRANGERRFFNGRSGGPVYTDSYSARAHTRTDARSAAYAQSLTTGRRASGGWQFPPGRPNGLSVSGGG